MKEIKVYADNAATSRLSDAAFEAMLPFLRNEYGNASQPYSLGRAAKEAIENARVQIAECIGASPLEIFFTSGGSESNNWVLRSYSEIHPNGKIITSPLEHHSILNALECVNIPNKHFVSVDSSGMVLLNDLDQLLDGCQLLVSVMMANNEIGTIQPIAKISRLCHHHNALFHCDAVQAVGHIPINVRDMDVDYMSASAHKFNGPKGIGFLYIKNCQPIRSLISGGSQESHLRAGTENVASIVGMATALTENISSLNKNMEYVRSLEDSLLNQLSSAGIEYIRNGASERTPGNISLSFKGQNGESILHRLDLKGICISTGSACDSTSTQVSHVLKAIGLAPEYAEGTIRISLGKENTLTDIKIIATALSDIINRN